MGNSQSRSNKIPVRKNKLKQISTLPKMCLPKKAKPPLLLTRSTKRRTTVKVAAMQTPYKLKMITYFPAKLRLILMPRLEAKLSLETIHMATTEIPTQCQWLEPIRVQSKPMGAYLLQRVEKKSRLHAVLLEELV